MTKTIRGLLRDPNDSSCTVAWDALTTEEQKAALKLYRALLKRVNVKYVIRISLKGPAERGEAGRAVYPHIIYPLEFASEEDAWGFLALSPDLALNPPGVKSWSVEAIRKPRPSLPEPRVRSTNLEKVK